MKKILIQFLALVAVASVAFAAQRGSDSRDAAVHDRTSSGLCVDCGVPEPCRDYQLRKHKPAVDRDWPKQPGVTHFENSSVESDHC